MKNEVKNLILLSYFVIHKFRYIAIFILALFFSFQGFCQQAGDLDFGFNFGQSGYHFNNYGYGANDKVLTTEFLSDNKILLGGWFTSYNGITRNGLVKLNSNGTIDNTFNVPFQEYSTILGVGVLPNGKILAVGYIELGRLTGRKSIVRLNENGTLDTRFNMLGNTNGAIYDIEVLPDGKAIICGDFTIYNGFPANGIARLNVDGSFDRSFYVGTPVNGPILSVAIQSDNKILLAGEFSNYNGGGQTHLTRLMPTGNIDLSFNPIIRPSNTVNKVLVQPDGKILIGGEFNSFNGIVRERICRLNSDGTLDRSFQLERWTSSLVKTIALKPDGKILIAGQIEDRNYITNSIIQLNSNGSIDRNFQLAQQPISWGYPRIMVHNISVNNRGEILVGGEFGNYGGVTRTNIIKVRPNGIVDESFNHGGAGANNWVKEIVLQPDGKVVVIGDFTGFNGREQNYLVRLNTNGSIDESFNIGSGPRGYVDKIALQPNGAIILSANTSFFNNRYVRNIFRINSTGELDTNYIPMINTNNWHLSWLNAIKIQPDGKLLVSGKFDSLNSGSKTIIKRLNIDGSLDSTFYPCEVSLELFTPSINSIEIQSDGKIIIGGNFTKINGISRKYVGRLNPDGTLDNSFYTHESVNSFVNKIAIQTDGKIVLAGVVNTTYRFGTGITRLNSDGSLDGTFNAGRGTEGPSESLAIQADGKIIIGGNFPSYNGVSRNRIARLNTNGRLDNSFNPGTGVDNEVKSILIQPDGKILIGGWFTGYNQYSSPGIARIYADTVPLLSNKISLTNSIKLYPNPSTGIVTLTTSTDAETIVVTNAVGQVVYTQKALPEMELNLSHLPKGVYMIQVQSIKGISTQQLVIQ